MEIFHSHAKEQYIERQQIAYADDMGKTGKIKSSNKAKLNWINIA